MSSSGPRRSEIPSHQRFCPKVRKPGDPRGCRQGGVVKFQDLLAGPSLPALLSFSLRPVPRNPVIWLWLVVSRAPTLLPRTPHNCVRAPAQHPFWVFRHSRDAVHLWPLPPLVGSNPTCTSPCKQPSGERAALAETTTGLATGLGTSCVPSLSCGTVGIRYARGARRRCWMPTANRPMCRMCARPRAKTELRSPGIHPARPGRTY